MELALEMNILICICDNICHLSIPCITSAYVHTFIRYIHSIIYC